MGRAQGVFYLNGGQADMEGIFPLLLLLESDLGSPLPCTADWGGRGGEDGPELLDRLLASPAFPMLSPHPSIFE